MAPETKPAKPRSKSKRTKVRSVYRTPDGRELSKKGVAKFYWDILSYWHGTVQNDLDIVTVYNPEDPWAASVLQPGTSSPICAKCGLCETKPNHPFVDYLGPEDPLVTVIYDGITVAEDESGEITTRGSARTIRNAIEWCFEKTGVGLDQIRWVPMTRCANRSGSAVNLKIKGNWCRYHAIEDLLRHPPRLIIPVGSNVLGLLSHKSNAQDWQGRVLTYRGWPDDWLTKPEFMVPRPHPADLEHLEIVGHPVFGPAPVGFRIPMVPIQTPRIIQAAQNPKVFNRWREQIGQALLMARDGVAAKSYTRQWYRFVNDPDAVEAGLREMLAHPGLRVAYDTETTGLKPMVATAAIVAMMFRWVDPVTGRPRSLGFPWNFKSAHYANRVVDHLDRLTPLVLEVLSTCEVICHNAPFDLLYTFFNLPHPNRAGLEPGSTPYNLQHDANLCALVDAFKWDTWHMAYTYKQQRGTLGLEAIAYDYAPDLAGYEEDMTLLIELYEDQLFPGAKNPPEGSVPHYLNIDESYYPDYVIPYVMGDVETCYKIQGVLQSKLEHARTFRIPLADPDNLTRFRAFQTPGRAWVYEKIMSPASRMLMKLMGRGMHVNVSKLDEMEDKYPNKVVTARNALRDVHPGIAAWCEAETAQDKGWALDLESKEHLRHILFDILQLPPQRLTKTGRKLYGETPADWQALINQGQMTTDDLRAFAALDKFTLNKLAVDHPEVRPLQDYKQVFKLYSTYIRPLRNYTAAGVDKKARVQVPHLCPDGRIHASFMLTGTRGGRLSCRDPNLQQLPNKGDVKALFTSRFGERGCMYQADLSQIELRLMAAACGDPTMIKAYLDEVDLHTLTTSRIFKLPYEHFSNEHRQWLQENGRSAEAKDLELKRRIGKTVNFLTGYGGGAFGLQTVLANSQVYLPIDECESIITKFFEAYPSLKEFLRYYKRFIENNTVAVSILGRVRIFEEVHSDDMEIKAKALRAGCNHIIQSTASDMMLIALIVIEELMRDAGLESILVSTVHDSLLIDCVRSELQQVHDIVYPVLNNFDQILPAYLGEDYDTSWMLVPFVGDCEVGPSYYDVRKIPKTNIDWDKLLEA